ncbi:putative conserved protein related to C-terminal domain of eukaryotic chaperone, SACSIN [Pyrobaculum oguniense TE7]|uniref:Conserved protein related to C-terminal domain of eukaryotic chaperone, SACSIN n=1 Tax=Pyrobaculum oguniense (strain DSM 13380 / JCM 10595 / TE7) TaxID=698757 RepID=H6QB01_PYROT|nr:putative conserved protein related to C-terminal domain of eukaryotic chaperone, SACSIN [Pyrobaculum oguniense TE7]
MEAREKAETLKRRSRAFLQTARFQIENRMYDLAVFNMEEALQLFLKAKLLEYGVQYPRTRGIRRLLRLLADAAPGEEGRRYGELLSRYLFELGVLEDAYINARYIPREYTREEAERLFSLVSEIISGG